MNAITIEDGDRTITLERLQVPVGTPSNIQHGVRIKSIDSRPKIMPFYVVIGFEELEQAKEWMGAMSEPDGQKRLVRALNSSELQILFSANW